jgi:hypothetical protein
MIEVNEYVRTKDGIVDKVIIEYDGKCNNSNCDEKHISCKYNYYNEKDIVKHSKQLIDLIEVGDFVNEYRVENVINEGPCSSGKCVDIDVHTLWEEDIQTILTKEQFEANCYKVGGEDEYRDKV